MIITILFAVGLSTLFRDNRIFIMKSYLLAFNSITGKILILKRSLMYYLAWVIDSFLMSINLAIGPTKKSA